MISALLLAACGGEADDDAGAAPLDVATLAEPGPWGIGYAAGEVTYADPVDAADRTLRTATWYPTDAADGELAAVGLYASTRAWVDAPVAQGPFPLAVFSHGYQGYAENSSFLAEHLASHGWIVVAPDHTGDTTFDDPERTTSIYLQRPLDVSATLDDALGRWPVEAGPVLALGHSFGGYTMFPLAGATYDVAGMSAACAGGSTASWCSDLDAADEARLTAGFADERLGAAVAMAPGDSSLFGDGLGTIDVPFLHMTATEDQGDGSEADTIWAALQGGDNRRVVLLGGGHQSFTDFSDVLEDVPLAREESWRIVDAYVLAWGMAMRGDPEVATLLDGEVTISTEAELRR